MTTWNLTEKGTGITLSNDNLTAAGITQTSSVKSTDPKTSGKWFCEVKIDTVNYNYIGIVPSNTSMTSSLSTSTNLFCYYYDGRKINGGVGVTYASPYTTGDTIGILVDFEDGILIFYKNGVNQGVAYNNIKMLTDFCIVASSGTISSTGKVTANFGATPFLYLPNRESLPSGVRSYDGSQFLSYEQKTLIKDNEGYKTLIEGNDFIAGINVIPKMINDTTPSPFVASASSSYSSYTAFYAFDQVFNGSSRWISNTVPPVWCKISLDVPRKAAKYQLASGYITQQISSWILQGSNDNNVWIDLDTVINHPLSIDKYDDFIIDSPDYYKHYRVYVNATTNNTIASLSGFTLLTEDISATVTHWKLVSTTTPTMQQFLEKGNKSLSVMDRKITTLEPMTMVDKSEILGVGETGKAFSKTIDLKKYFDIRSMEIEVE